MNKQHRQVQIARQQVRDTLSTNAWLEQQHICTERLYDTGTRLIQAEARARQLIKDYKAQLTEEQQATITSFLRRIENRRTRQRMREDSGNSIFRIHTQLKRRQHAQKNSGTPTVLPTANR
jgi:hypothetical protein